MTGHQIFQIHNLKKYDFWRVYADFQIFSRIHATSINRTQQG